MNSKRKKLSINRKERIIFTILALIIPLSNFAVFTIGMNGQMFVNSFFGSAIVEGEGTVDKFVGFENFVVLFRNLTDLTGAETIPFSVLKNTLSIIPISILTTCISLIMSYAVARKFFGYRFFKIALYAPSILNTVLLCIIFRQTFVKIVGEKTFNNYWMSNPDREWLLVVIYAIWTGCVINLYFVSAFARMPQSVYESAELDGASETVIFFKIAFPLVSSLFVTLLLSSVCGSFAFFGPIEFLEISNKEAQTIGYMLVNFANKGGSKGQIGLFSALGVVITIIGSIVALLTRWVGSKLSVDDLEY